MTQIAKQLNFTFHSRVSLIMAKIEVFLHKTTRVIATLGWLFIKAIESDVPHSSYVNTSRKKIHPSYSICIQFSDIVWSDDPFISSYSLLTIKVCYCPMSFTFRESQTSSWEETETENKASLLGNGFQVLELNDIILWLVIMTLYCVQKRSLFHQDYHLFPIQS